ncbi:MAG: DDE-type integrase/transposase/recombinase [Steroidobacteraceae bacterium]
MCSCVRGYYAGKYLHVKPIGCALRNAVKSFSKLERRVRQVLGYPRASGRLRIPCAGDVGWPSPFSGPVGTSWRVDETCVAIRGKWHYLYPAVDKRGKTVDFLLRPDRGIQDSPLLKAGDAVA